MRDLMEYVRANAEEFGIDPDRLCVWVFSAGMPIGTWAAMHDAPPYVRCIVAYYGVMDLHSVRDRLPPDIPEEVLDEFSALRHLREHPHELAPIFIAKAGLDRPGLNASIDLFVDEARRLNARVELMVHETGRHAFDVLDDDERSREIIERTLKFIKENV